MLSNTKQSALQLALGNLEIYLTQLLLAFKIIHLRGENTNVDLSCNQISAVNPSVQSEPCKHMLHFQTKPQASGQTMVFSQPLTFFPSMVCSSSSCHGLVWGSRHKICINVNQTLLPPIQLRQNGKLPTYTKEQWGVLCPLPAWPLLWNVDCFT